MLLFGVIAVIGICLSLITNVWAIIFGRFLHGTSNGVFLSVGPRMMDEFVPQHLLGHFGAYTSAYCATSMLIVQLMGMGLPQGDNPTDVELGAD